PVRLERDAAPPGRDRPARRARAGHLRGAAVTLRTFAEKWLLALPVRIHPRTAKLYAGQVRVHIGPALGDRELADKITRATVQGVRGRARGEGPRVRDPPERACLSRELPPRRRAGGTRERNADARHAG